MGIDRRSFTALGLAFLALLPGPRLQAQGVLLEGQASARISADSGGVQVGLLYRLLPDSGTRDVPLSLLTPDPVRLTSLTAWLGRGEWGPVAGFSGIEGRDVSAPPGAEGEVLSLREVRAHYREGVFHIPDSVGEGDTLSLGIAYTLEGVRTAGGRLTIPLVAPRWVPVDPAPTTFQARVDVPPGLTVTGSFPTSVLSRPPEGEGGAFEVGLQGVPAALILWTTTGQAPPLTLERGLDLLVVASLLLLGAMGFRALVRKGE